MKNTFTELEKMITEVAASIALEVYDIEWPKGPSGTMRIFLSKSDSKNCSGENSVNLDDCANFSKAFSDNEAFEELFNDSWMLEVSSPGVNRRLRTEKHFLAAIGERIKLKYIDNNSQTKTSHVVLEGFGEGKLKVVLANNMESDAFEVSLNNVVDASVYFDFDKQ